MCPSVMSVVTRGSRLAALMLVVGVAGAPVAARAQTPAPPPTCAPAAELLRVRLLDDAKTAYGEALKAGATAGCAFVGSSLAEAFAERGDALRDVGNADAAITAYVSAVELEPSRAASLAMRSRAVTTKLADALHDAGLDAEARAVLVARLKADPGFTIAPELREVVDDERWADKFADPARTLLELVVVVLGGAAAALFVFSRLRRRLKVGEFAGPAEVGKAPATTDVGAELQAEVRARIAAFANACDPEFRSDVEGYDDGAAALPATLVDGLPQAALLAALVELLDRVVPGAERELTVLLLTPTAAGRGVALRMSSRSRRSRGTVVIRDRDLPAAACADVAQERYHQFADVIAAWALWRFDERAFRRLGTNDPFSLAATANGAAVQGGIS